MINLEDLLEEISLEGLAGCRFDDLWQRLYDRKGQSLTTEVKDSIWNVLRDGSRGVVFYASNGHGESSELAEGNECKPKRSNAIMGLDAVFDPVTGDRGICSDYARRQNISHLVSEISLNKAIEKWGDSLVMVASKDLRLSSLVGPYSDPCFILLNNEYIVLEVIGKCRFNGITRIELAKVVGVNAKTIFHPVRGLVSKRLIRERKELDGKRLTTRIYLTRFYRENEDKLQQWKRLCNFLAKQPDKTADFKEINSTVFSNDTLAFKRARQLLVRNGTVKKLQSPTTNMSSLVLIDNDAESASDSEEQHPDLIMNSTSEAGQGRVYPAKWMDNKAVAEKSFIAQLYEHIEAAGNQGVTQQEMAVHYGVSQLYIRSGLKILQHMKVLGKFVQDRGRQQTETHVALLPIRKISGNTDRIDGEKYIENKDSQAGDESTRDPDQDMPVNTETLRMGGQTLIDTRTTWLKDFIEKSRVVHGLTPMSIGLREYEKKQGRTHIVCSKTVQRLVSRLIKTGEIDVITTDISGQSCQFYMTKGMTTADEVFQTAVNHVRLSFDRGKAKKSKKPGSAVTVKEEKTTRKTEQTDQQQPDHPDIAKLLLESQVEGMVDSSSVERLQEDVSQETTGLLDTKIVTVKKKNQKAKVNEDGAQKEPESIESEGTRKFVLMPKFHRLRTLHKFLWQGLCLAAEDSTANTLTLPCSSKGEGWVLLSVAFNYMSLQSFLESIGFVGKSLELETFLEDPKNAEIPMKDLPPTLLKSLCARQPHVYGIMYDLVKGLEAMGLLRIESVSDTEHHGNVHLSVEQSHVLLDTKMAKPAYCQLKWGEVKSFQRLEYSFQTLSNVNQYWFDLERICATTSMGRRNIRTDREKIECQNRHAPIKRLNFDELEDDDDVVGAAGLPWRLFPHVRRSWTNAIHQSSNAASAAATVAPEHYTWTTPGRGTKEVKKVQVVVEPGKKLNEERKGGKGYKRVRPTDGQESVAKKIKVSKKASQVKKQEQQKKSRVIRDTVDQEAQSLKKTLRVSFTEEEDNLVVICGAAKDFVKKRFSYDPPWVEIRNIYQEVAGQVASDKTSFAIQRRLAYIRRYTLSLSSKLKSLLCELGQEEFEGISTKDSRECLKIYKDLVVKIWRKHGGKLLVSSSLPVANIPALPGSLTQLLSEYTISYDVSKSGSGEMKSVSRIDDSDPVSIRRSILKNILLCAYAGANSQVEFSSYQLYQFLQSYPPEDLEAVYEEFKEKNYLSKKRNYKGDDHVFPSYLTLGSAYHRPFTVQYPREVFSTAIDIESLPVIETIPLSISESKEGSEVNRHSPKQETAMDVDSVPVVECAWPRASENREEEQMSRDNDKDNVGVGVHACQGLHTSVLDLSQMNGSCVASLLPKMFNPEVVVDARLPDSLFDLVENSGRRPSEKSEMEADMSSDDDEPKNEDNKKDKKTWTESLQDHLCVSEHEEAKDSLITISHHVIQIKGDEKVENSDCSNTVDNELSVPKWCACTDSELDAGFEDSCISDEEVVSICQQMGWQVAEIADLMFVLSEVKQSGWQGIEKEFLLNSSALQQKCQSSMPISNLAQTLLNFGVVHTVGFAAQRFVCHEGCQLWHFEAVCKNSREECTGSKAEDQAHDQQESTKPASCTNNREAKYLVPSRPWITCSGSLDQHHLIYSLQAVLNQIMSKPGITKDAVQKTMGEVIHPVAIQHLLDLLEMMQCIQVQVMQATEKPSLFSKPQVLLPGTDPTRSVAHLFATADCLSRLAKSLNTGGKTE